MRHREQDFTEFIYPATMHQTMLFFTKKGRCYWLKCYNIPEGKEVIPRALHCLVECGVFGWRIRSAGANAPPVFNP